MEKTRYKDRTITVSATPFGKDTAVEVKVDGAIVLNLYDSRALFCNRAEALSQGRKFGQEHIDMLPSSIDIKAIQPGGDVYQDSSEIMR